MKKYDVIVAGGGPSGVAAAIAAARNGCKTLIIEKEACFGGMATVAGVPAFGPFTNGVEDLIGGIGREILEHLKKECYHSPFYDRKPDRIEGIDWHPIDSEILKRVLDKMVLESGCEILFHTSVIGADVENGTIKTVTIYNKGGSQKLEACYFVDCTGDADLAAMAGVEFAYGDEHRQVQASTLCFKMANICMKTFLSYAERVGESGNLAIAVEKARQDQDFPVNETKLGGIAFVGEGVAVFNFGHVYDVKPLETENLTQKEMEARKNIPMLVAFLKNYVPGMRQAVLVGSGPSLGIRESRRIKGSYTLTKEDYFSRADFEDAIAYYSYPIDLHAAMPEQGEAQEKQYQESKYAIGESYGIPYRSLVSQHMSNLLVAGRTISAEREMMSSVRIMSPCFATGQAAGTAAALCINRRCEVSQADTKRLRKMLHQQGAYIKY